MKRSVMRGSVAKNPDYASLHPGYELQITPSLRIAPATGLRLVEPERVELGELVQKARLRRDAHGKLCSRNQDGLAQLPIPRAIAELAPLEGGEIELGRFQVCDQVRGRRRFAARCSLADRAHRDPDVIVEGPHGAIGEPPETILQLGRTPLLKRRMPAGRHQ